MAQSGGHDLSGRTVIVTGVGRGLGNALFRSVIQAGAYAVGCVRSEADVARVAAEGKTIAAAVPDDAARDRQMVLQGDVTSPEAMENLVHIVIEHTGRIDGLVLNASILDERRPLRDVDPDDWRRVVDVNLNGAFNACRAVVPSMRKAGRGSIVAVSSGAADRPRAEWGAYAVSKHALEAFALNLSLEERDSGVRVNIVDPGAMRTSMRAAAYPEEDPATLPRPEDHVDVYLWLLGTASAGVTGQRFAARDWRPPA